MTISLRDYDFAAARRGMLARVDPVKRIVRDHRGELDYDRTASLRRLEGVGDVLLDVEVHLRAALCTIPVDEGGLVQGGKALATAMRPDLPLVQALLILGSHPAHRGYTHVPLDSAGRTVPENWKNTAHDAGPFLASQPRPPWSLAALEAVVQRGVVSAYGDSRVDPARLPYEQAPGSKLDEYLRVLGTTAMYDAIGGWDPAFSRRDALAGEWWLLQPISPRLEFNEVASKAGLELAGFLPPNKVDVAGRVVMVCFPRNDMSDEKRIERISESKWIAGWKHVVWSTERIPLSDLGFHLLDHLAGVTASSYGPYKHSSELPPWGAADQDPAAAGKARAQQLAQAVLDALAAPPDWNEDAMLAMKDRRQRKGFEASYLRSKQKGPKPPRVFAGPARTLEELRFAASLEHCSTCDDQLEPDGLKTRSVGGGTWEVSGKCPRCEQARSYRYAAASDVERASHVPHELGSGSSRMITAAQFHEALDEARPVVAPAPASLDDEDHGISSTANHRVLTCLNELIKLEGDALAPERDQQLVLRAAHDKVKR